MYVQILFLKFFLLHIHCSFSHNNYKSSYTILWVLAIPFDWCIARYHRTITSDFQFCGYT